MRGLRKKNSLSQSGNALFLILIAVALFAALSFAIGKSRSSSSTIAKEKVSLDVSRMLQKAAYIRSGAQRMVLSGTRPADLDLAKTAPDNLEPCDTGTNCLFSAAGGGLLYESAPQSLGLGGNIGPYFVEVADGITFDGIGGNQPSAYLIVAPISEEVCLQINRKLGLGDSIATDSDPNDTLIDAYPGKREACFEGDGGSYIFYMILVEV